MTVAGLLLWHGAGGNREHRHFLGIGKSLDIPVRRLNFGYRELGPKRPPPRADKLVDEVCAAVEEAGSELGVDSNRLVLGGRSMGGRVCSLAVAAGLESAGLVMLSYPLHPPGKPEKLRVDHFPSLDLPCLFVSGDRDPFGKPPEWPEHLATIPGPVTMEWLEGDGHDPKKNDDLVVSTVAAWVERL
ncbi:MAG: alpha/beta hydrolase family protein [Acidimicrobiales bacterium]